MMKQLIVTVLSSLFLSVSTHANIIIEAREAASYEITWQDVSLFVETVNTYDNIFETTLIVGKGENATTFDFIESYFSAPQIRLVELDPTNETPEILVTSFSGGAHCCQEIFALSNIENTGWERVEIGAFDTRTAPNTIVDMDGDGSAELNALDDRFLYQFASYAESFAPPRILSLRGLEVVERTKEKAVQSYVQQALDDLGTAPEKGPARNSWLATYAAILLMQQQDDPLDFATSSYDPDVEWGVVRCTDKTKDESSCPSDQLINIGFEAALSDFLIETGHLEPAQ